METGKAVIDEKQSNRQIRIGAVLGYIAFFLNIAYGLFFTPWVAKNLGDNYGVYTIASNLITLFLVDLGLGKTSTVFVSRYRKAGDEEGLKKFVTTTSQIYLALDVVLALILLVVFFLLPTIYSNRTEWPLDKLQMLKNTFLISSVFSLISFPSQALSGIISGYEKHGFIKLADLGSKAAYIIITLVLLLVINRNGNNPNSIYGLTIGFACSGLVSVIWRFIYAKTKLKLKFNIFSKPDFTSCKKIIGFTIFIALISIFSRLIFTISPVIIGATAGSMESGTFGFIATIEGYIFTFGTVLCDFFIPKISRTIDEKNDGDPKALLDLGIKVGKITLLFVALVEFGFICCGKEFVHVWLSSNEGYNYDSIYYGIVIISIYQLFCVPVSIFNSSLYVSKKGTKILSALYGCRAILNVGLCVLFSSFMGALGACVSILISRFIEQIVENIVFKKFLHVDLWKFYKEVYFSQALYILIPFGLGLGLRFALANVDISNLIKFFIIGCSFVVFYAVSIFLSLKKETRSDIIQKIRKFFTKNEYKETKAISKVTKKPKVTLLIVLSVLLAIPALFTAGAAIAKDSIGIAGTYCFYYEDKLVQKFTLSIFNNMTFYEYPYGKETTIKYKWRMDLNTNEEPDPSIEKWSVYQLQVCNSSWGSYWQYYYVDGVFYSKRNYSQYGDKQIVFVKEGR